MKISWIVLTVCLVLSIGVLTRHPVVTLASSPAAASGQPAPGQSPSAQSSGSHRLADSAEAKFMHIQQNGEKPRPDPAPTVFSEEEINAYLASGRVELPQGVKKVRLQGLSGQVTGFLTVDFDQIKQNQHSSNMLLSLFSGTHDVTVETDAAGSAGEGKVHVRTVSLDGTEVPRMALEYFAEKYITPKYPNVGLDSQFKLPNRIDMATVGYHKISIVQK
ncbi:MAG TPA: hypothetical protein VFR08_08660 [Candidatus Angelobacter sp.]|nr:hypothetical protein [Candidatus Angelobacter sp.]